jgi:hypothetical protein
MADYYSLIKKAVARLDPEAPTDSRRALYERARVAQLKQLRSISPSLSNAEITREQLALEEAVRRVEAETTQGRRDVPLPALNDLIAAADEIGKTATRIEGRSTGAQARDLPNPPPDTNAPTPPTMMVTGGATGRLVRYWRWRPLPPRQLASKESMGNPAVGR